MSSEGFNDDPPPPGTDDESEQESGSSYRPKTDVEMDSEESEVEEESDEVDMDPPPGSSPPEPVRGSRSQRAKRTGKVKAKAVSTDPEVRSDATPPVESSPSSDVGISRTPEVDSDSESEGAPEDQPSGSAGPASVFPLRHPGSWPQVPNETWTMTRRHLNVALVGLQADIQDNRQRRAKLETIWRGLLEVRKEIEAIEEHYRNNDIAL